MAISFISDKEIEDLKATRGERFEDGTVTVDRPLFEILQEAKDKKDEEFKNKFKNLPPKSLDDEETEFLDAVDKYNRERDREVAEEERNEITNFKTAIAERTIRVEDRRPLSNAAHQDGEARSGSWGDHQSSASASTRTGGATGGISEGLKRKEAPKVNRMSVLVQPKRVRDGSYSGKGGRGSGSQVERGETQRGSGHRGREREKGGERVERQTREEAGVRKIAVPVVPLEAKEKGKVVGEGETKSQGLAGLVSYADDEDDNDDV
eukprot:TRINITY_DN39071_c0_g1_i1.p1 TRINITY_DN39071_c0_g1~~TRINITY_DN39071_c0_g1_i1.p1  ORF type:complete len:265 (+),score=52.34 TRINITY_DN39071_c0_g1_i1:282-1076(+)